MNKTDIEIMFGDQQVGLLKTLSYSVSREMTATPCRDGGSLKNHKEWKGKTCIAGVAIFKQFDTDPFYDLVLEKHPLRFSEGPDDLLPEKETQLQTVPPLLIIIDQAHSTFVKCNDMFDWKESTTECPLYFAISGVELMNDGYNAGIDDIVSDTAFTFVAREIARNLDQDDVLRLIEEEQEKINACFI